MGELTFYNFIDTLCGQVTQSEAKRRQFEQERLRALPLSREGMPLSARQTESGYGESGYASARERGSALPPLSPPLLRGAGPNPGAGTVYHPTPLPTAEYALGSGFVPGAAAARERRLPSPEGARPPPSRSRSPAQGWA